MGSYTIILFDDIVLHANLLYYSPVATCKVGGGGLIAEVCW